MPQASREQHLHTDGCTIWQCLAGHIQFCFQVRDEFPPPPSSSPFAGPFPLAASQFGVSFMWVNVARAKVVNKRATQRPLIWLSAFDCEK